MNETRAEEAKRLVDEDCVPTQPRYTRVGTRHGPCFVKLYGDGTFFCTCDWSKYRNYTDDLCAHALAVKLMTEKENQP